MARLGTCDDLDDLVQESFLRAYKGLARLKERARFAAYLHRIARNICVDWLRRKKRDGVSLDDVPVEIEVPMDGPLDIREERLAQLRRLVGRLPLGLREAVLMFYFERQSYQQIAEVLGVTEAAVNQRLHRARVALRTSLGVNTEQSG
jgi:RNA polymerase sigma-70 factor (ECF subfamily)